MKNLKSIFLLIILLFTLSITACKKSKDEDVTPHSHNYVDGICSCGDVQTVKFTVMFLDFDGNVVKNNASISGAEAGCQAEIGTACAEEGNRRTGRAFCRSYG